MLRADCTCLLLCAGALSACVQGPNVQRIYDGALVEGRYIEAPAYSAFLRASIADGAGDASGARVSRSG